MTETDPVSTTLCFVMLFPVQESEHCPTFRYPNNSTYLFKYEYKNFRHAIACYAPCSSLMGYLQACH
jgi:hypothetical protein